MEITFLGAAQEVTGSCFLIKNDQNTILVDCGLVQGSHKHELQNWQELPFDAQKIDAVVITHAHIDHSGKLPLIVQKGFKGPIYTHEATKDLCEIMLLDSAFLHERDAQIENKKRHRKHLPPIEPLYTLDDVKATLPLFDGLQYNERKEILPGITITLNDAGHIIGSAILELFLQEKGVHRKIVFSGDLGHEGKPILKDPTFINKADFVVMESTYGNRLHRPWKDTWEEFSQVITEAQQDKGNILIPSFAVERTQQVLYAFHKNFDKWNLHNMLIFLDSPMAIQATRVYKKYWNLYDKESKKFHKNVENPYKFPNLFISQTTDDSMKINQISSGAIIIAGSGMCSGGRIMHHLKQNVWRKGCNIIIIGFQAQGTIGRELVEGAKKIRLWGEEIKVAAKVHTIGGFSAHADQKHLLEWYGHFSTLPPVALVHGELTAMQALKEALYKQYTVHGFMPTFGTTIDLVKLKMVSK